MKTNQSVTCKVKYIPMQVEFMVTFVNVFNIKEDTVDLWKYLKVISLGCQEPWFVLGDFNPVLKSEDRLGGNPVSLEEVCDFQ